jgi:hypothetical protein
MNKFLLKEYIKSVFYEQVIKKGQEGIFAKITSLLFDKRPNFVKGKDKESVLKDISNAFSGLDKNNLNWIGNYLNDPNTVNDGINYQEFLDFPRLVESFEQYKNFIDRKNIHLYKTFSELREIIQSASDRKNKKLKVKDEYENAQYDTIYKDEEFVVYFPKNKQASCKLGKETTWCVAARDYNLFNHYTTQSGDEDSLFFIFFIFSRSENIKQNPMSRLSIGMSYDGEIEYEGFSTTNGIDKAVTENEVINYVGNERYQEIISAMKRYVNKQKYHPNFDLSDEKDNQTEFRKSILNGSLSIEDIYIFFIQSNSEINYRSGSNKKFVLNNYRFSEDDFRFLIKREIFDVFDAKIIPESIIIEFIENEENIFVKNKIARRTNIPSELLDRLTDISIERYMRYIRQKNQNIYYGSEDYIDYDSKDLYSEEQYTDKDYSDVINNLYDNEKLSNKSRVKIENFIMDENLNDLLNEIITKEKSSMKEEFKLRIYEKYKNQYDKSSSRNILKNLFTYYYDDEKYDKLIYVIMRDNIFPIIMDLITIVGGVLSQKFQVFLSRHSDVDIRKAFAKEVTAVDAIENLSKDPDISVRKSLVNKIALNHLSNNRGNFRHAILPILERMLEREESGEIESSPELIQQIKKIIDISYWVLGIKEPKK